MVDWWLALIFALLPIGSGVLVWYLNAKKASETQERQHKFDARMQQQRLDADRQTRSDDARRAELRKRLEPVHEALNAFESWLTYQLWVQALEAAGTVKAAQRAAVALIPDDVPEDLVESVLEEMRTQNGPTVPRVQDVMLKLYAASTRVGDKDLRESMGDLLAILTTQQADRSEAYRRLSAAYERLEAYITRPREE